MGGAVERGAVARPRRLAALARGRTAPRLHRRHHAQPGRRSGGGAAASGRARSGRLRNSGGNGPGREAACAPVPRCDRAVLRRRSGCAVIDRRVDAAIFGRGGRTYTAAQPQATRRRTQAPRPRHIARPTRRVSAMTDLRDRPDAIDRWGAVIDALEVLVLAAPGEPAVDPVEAEEVRRLI